MSQERKCENCNGTGKVEENDDMLEICVFGASFGSGIFTTDKKCPECNGTGKIKQAAK